MWKRLRSISLIIFYIALALLVSSCFLSASYATAPASEPSNVVLSYSEYNQLKSNLIQLQSNSQKQLMRINQLEMLLKAASASTTESSTALIEAQMQLTTAKQQISEQQTQLQKLNALLETQSQQLSKANVSLAKAEQSLTELSLDLKRAQAKERKNKVWAVIATTAAVYFAAR